MKKIIIIILGASLITACSSRLNSIRCENQLNALHGFNKIFIGSEVREINYHKNGNLSRVVFTKNDTNWIASFYNTLNLEYLYKNIHYKYYSSVEIIENDTFIGDYRTNYLIGNSYYENGQKKIEKTQSNDTCILTNWFNEKGKVIKTTNDCW